MITFLKGSLAGLFICLFITCLLMVFCVICHTAFCKVSIQQNILKQMREQAIMMMPTERMPLILIF